MSFLILRQEKEGFSIPAQLKLLKEYAAREGYDIVSEYVDVETAKTRSGRASYNEMVAFLTKEAKSRRENRCRTILVEKTDRLYRNLLDYGKFGKRATPNPNQHPIANRGDHEHRKRSAI